MIRIECKGADTLPLDAIEEFQGSLKKRSKKDIDLITTSINKYGFSFPFFIWNGTGHNYCLDGHGRIQALCEMRKRGENLPLFPVVYVDAKDEEEAKNKLLRLNSQYGQMTVESVLEFADGIEIDFEEIMLSDGSDLELMSQKSIDLSFMDTDGTMKDALDHFGMTLTFENQYEDNVKALVKKIGKSGIVDKIIEMAEEK